MTRRRILQANQPARSARPLCMVLGCGEEALLSWTSSTAWRGWPVEWLVCPSHYAKLLADHDWELVHGQPPSWHPWILMGDDVGSESRDVDDQLVAATKSNGHASALPLGRRP